MDQRNRLPLTGNAVLLDEDAADHAEGPTCAQCRFWHKSPPARDPQTKAIDMSAPPRGECRIELKSVPIMGTSQQGPILLGFAAGYPSTPPDYPACGQYQDRGEG